MSDPDVLDVLKESKNVIATHPWDVRVDQRRNLLERLDACIRALEARPVDGAADKLNVAIQQTILHLETQLEMEKHPDSCVCYGCNLRRVHFDWVWKISREAVAPIVKAEVQAENQTRGLHLDTAMEQKERDERGLALMVLAEDNSAIKETDTWVEIRASGWNALVAAARKLAAKPEGEKENK